MSEIATPIVERPRFWSDDFDMDLLKVFPDVPKMLREPERVLWTVGHEKYGRLNHPTTWNSHGAFLWLKAPLLERDKEGWFDIYGHVSDSSEIECTWLEWLRDAWSHHYGTVILPFQSMMPAPNWPDFEAIMYDLRGWNKRDVSEHRKRSLQWIMRCESILNACICKV